MATTQTTDKPRGAEVIKQALAHVPLNPGVYLMKDARGRVIYVGKAKHLKNRLTSYTRPPAGPTWYANKVATMVKQVAAVDFVITASEKEALLLENTLIKKHRPRYNADLRDDKSYPYFRLNLEHDFPACPWCAAPNSATGPSITGPSAAPEQPARPCTCCSASSPCAAARTTPSATGPAPAWTTKPAAAPPLAPRR